jgi:hypothetical protein
MPTSTDLVTDLPADFEVFGQAVDTSLADLKGGTTGQVLAKASNTDMDFVWSADASGIPASAFTAKGNILVGTGTSTYAAQAVGTNGQVLTANSAQADGVEWTTPSSGAYTLISTTNATGSSNVDLTSIAGTYKDLLIIVEDFYFSGGPTNCDIKLNTTQPSYGWTYWQNQSAATQGFQSGGSFSMAQYSDFDASDNNNMMWLKINDYASAFPSKLIEKTTKYRKNYGGVQNMTETSNYYFNDTTAVSRVQLDVIGVDTFVQGTVYLYGVK